MQKEAKETRHWLRMIARANPELRDVCKILYQESKELQLIFISIIKKSKNNKD